MKHIMYATYPAGTLWNAKKLADRIANTINADADYDVLADTPEDATPNPDIPSVVIRVTVEELDGPNA